MEVVCHTAPYHPTLSPEEKHISHTSAPLYSYPTHFTSQTSVWIGLLKSLQ